MSQLFSIFQFIESNPDSTCLLPDYSSAHSHDYKELVTGVKGEAEHFIGYTTQIMTAPFISFVASGKIHKITFFGIAGKCIAWGLKFKSEFVRVTTFQLYSYDQDRADLQISRNSCFKPITTIVEIL